MKVIVAESAGFCYGVKRAVELAEQAAVAGSPCQMLGPIIHNEHVVRNLAQAGIPCAAEPEEILRAALRLSVPTAKAGRSISAWARRREYSRRHLPLMWRAFTSWWRMQGPGDGCR